MIGQMVGKYRIVRKLGEGGMGAVFEGINDQFGRRAAVKLLKPELSRDPEMAARFANEARAASMIQHPGIISVFDIGQLDDGSAYIVMDYLEGEPLRARLPTQPGQANSALLRLFQQTASALAAAHDKQIVHRDLKPDNVMVVADPDVAGGERVKVLDFGIAKLAPVGDAAGAAGFRTRTGMLMGTPIYMAPEQCKGAGAVDAKADVYSLGVMLFQALAGRPPFESDSLYGLMSQHVSEAPPALAAVAPGTAPGLLALVDASLRKDAAGRPTMREFAAALELHLTGSSATLPALQGGAGQGGSSAAASASPSVARPGSQRFLAIAAALVLVGGGGAAIFLARGGSKTDGGTSPPLSTSPSTSPSIATSPSSPSPSTEPTPAVPTPPPEMVALPETVFTMGLDTASVATELSACETAKLGDCKRELLERELYAHSVTISALWVDRTEVSAADFATFLNSAGAKLEGKLVLSSDARTLADLAKGSPLGFNGDAFEARTGFAAHPATRVTWAGAVAYCEARGKRLPTEAEWERAARGPGRRFPWGNEATACAEVVLARGKGGACAGTGTGPVSADVGSAPGDVTATGVHDLGGNVGEWVADLFAAPYADCPAPCRDPQPATVGDRRVVRGGSYALPRSAARGGARGRLDPAERYTDLGFRCVQFPR